MTFVNAAGLAAALGLAAGVLILDQISRRRRRRELMSRSDWSTDDFLIAMGIAVTEEARDCLAVTLKAFGDVLRVPPSKLRPSDTLRGTYRVLLDRLLLDSYADVALDRVSVELRRSFACRPTIRGSLHTLGNVVEQVLSARCEHSGSRTCTPM